MTGIERNGRSIPVAGLLAVLLVTLIARPAIGDARRTSVEPVIGSISFRVASPWMISYEELYGLVTVRPGEPLTPGAVQESIRLLNRKGQFRELSVHVREEGGKAHLMFYLRPLPAVSEIRVTGRHDIPASRIIAASRIRRGMSVDEEDLAEAEKSVLALLHGKGFLDAAVDVSAACSLDTGTGTVRIEVEEGRPAVPVPAPASPVREVDGEIPLPLVRPAKPFHPSFPPSVLERRSR
ncbi:MAG TPA: POTRA domain-containing protein [Candidatus Aquicultoraceae bacterium]|nr:POTRA domain-containing protein [Candidatus Aquicultoraceae bacterium]